MKTRNFWSTLHGSTIVFTLWSLSPNTQVCSTNHIEHIDRSNTDEGNFSSTPIFIQLRHDPPHPLQIFNTVMIINQKLHFPFVLYEMYKEYDDTKNSLMTIITIYAFTLKSFMRFCSKKIAQKQRCWVETSKEWYL